MKWRGQMVDGWAGSRGEVESGQVLFSLPCCLLWSV